MARTQAPAQGESQQDDLVVVVSGASRGLGRGTAIEMGERGATVYVVGRTTTSGTQVSAGGRAVPGSIHETADAVTSAGGRGIPVACDLSRDDDVARLFEQVRAEHGRLDILVNNAASLHDDMDTRPFWAAPPETANILDVGLRCHQVATRLAAPLLIEGRRGLVVNISFYGNARSHDPAYYAAKAGLDKLAQVWAEDFAEYDVAAVSLWPGFVKTERGEALLGEAMEVFEGSGMESPRYCGRVMKALWDDPELMSLSGKTLIAAELGERYGVSDLEGYAPTSLRDRFGAPHPQFDL